MVGKCIIPSNGNVATVANRGGTLKLSTLKARYAGIRTARSVGTDGGYITETASGTFVIVALTVENRLDTPQSFDGSGSRQTELLVGSKTFSEDFDAENQADQRSFLSQDAEQQPGEERTGEVVYDVPNKFVGRALKNGVVLIANFGADLDTTRHFGVIRLGR